MSGEGAAVGPGAAGGPPSVDTGPAKLTTPEPGAKAPEAAKPDPKEREREERNRDRQIHEAGIIGRAKVTALAQESGVTKRAIDKPKEFTDPTDQALFLHEQFVSGEFYVQRDGKMQRVNGLNFTDNPGNPLLVPPMENEDGSDMFDGQDVAIAEVRLTPQGEYECTFAYVYPDGGLGEFVTEGDGDEAPAMVRILPKEILIDAQIESEIGIFDDLMDGDPGFGLFLDSRPQSNPDWKPRANTDEILHQAAEDTGVPRISTLIDAVSDMYPEGSSNPRSEKAQAFIDKLTQQESDGEVILSKKDFVTGMDLLGVGKGSIDAETDRLIAERDDEKHPPSAERKKVIDAKLDVLKITRDFWQKAEDADKSPMEICFDKALDGRLPKGLLDKVIEGGDPKNVAQLFVELMDKSELETSTREKILHALATGSIKTAKGGGIFLVVVAALAAAASLGGATYVGSMLRGGGER